MKTITAIICITILDIVALSLGYNGAFLIVAVATISGLGGFAIKHNPFSNRD